MKRGLLFLMCWCGFWGITKAQTNAYRIDSLSYENYLQMLDKESIIPLSDIRDEEKPEYLKERRAFYGNDRTAYKTKCEEILRANQNVFRYAMETAKSAGLRSIQANVLESVYRYFNDIELRMVEEIGPKKYVSHYIAAAPRFAHLQILKEAKIQEMLNRDDHIRYFMKMVLPFYRDGKRQVIKEEDFKGRYYIRMPIFTKGVIIDWICQNVRYPLEAQQNNWQGKAFVRFVVDLDGSVSDVSVIKSNCAPCLNQEAIRVVKTLPRFIPAWNPVMQSNVRVNLTVPINFRLQNGPSDARREQLQIMEEMNQMRSKGAVNNTMR